MCGVHTLCSWFLCCFFMLFSSSSSYSSSYSSSSYSLLLLVVVLLSLSLNFVKTFRYKFFYMLIISFFRIMHNDGTRRSPARVWAVEGKCDSFSSYYTSLFFFFLLVICISSFSIAASACACACMGLCVRVGLFCLSYPEHCTYVCEFMCPSAACARAYACCVIPYWWIN